MKGVRNTPKSKTSVMIPDLQVKIRTHDIVNTIMDVSMGEGKFVPSIKHRVITHK